MAAAFATTRLRGRFEPVRPPSDAVGAFAEVVFPEPVCGPLAFGFGAHFGLGLMAPVEIAEDALIGAREPVYSQSRRGRDEEA
jgi:hypothetical protein